MKLKRVAHGLGNRDLALGGDLGSRIHLSLLSPAGKDIARDGATVTARASRWRWRRSCVARKGAGGERSRSGEADNESRRTFGGRLRARGRGRGAMQASPASSQFRARGGRGQVRSRPEKPTWNRVSPL